MYALNYITHAKQKPKRNNKPKLLIAITVMTFTIIAPGILFFQATASNEYTQSIPISTSGSITYSQATPAYTVFVNNGAYQVENDSTQKVIFSSQNVNKAIKEAFNSLDVSRTWKETVALQGNFVINSPISVPSYSIVQINGKLTLQKESNCSILTLTGVNNVEIVGGYLDGNRINQGKGVWDCHGIRVVESQDVLINHVNVMSCQLYGIYVDKSSQITVQNTYVSNCSDNNVEFQDCSNCLIQNSVLTETSDYALTFFGSTSCKAVNVTAANVLFNNCILGRNAHVGFGAESGSTDSVFDNCTVYNCRVGFSDWGSPNTQINNPTIYNLTGPSDTCRGIDSNSVSTNLQVSGGNIYNVDSRGVSLRGKGSSVSGVTISNINYVGGVGLGILCGNSTVVTNCILTNCYQGINVDSGSTNSIVTYNIFTNCATNIVNNGVNTVIISG